MFVESCNKCQYGLKCPCGNSLHSVACLNIAKEGKPKLTNADKIRSMNDEELAVFLNTLFIEGQIEAIHEQYPDSVFNRKDDSLKWLQSEAE